MATALIGLGANLGDRAAALEKAVELLQNEPEIRVEAVSSFRPSKPVGGPEGQAEFLNAAARLETSLSPEALLARLLDIEALIGRVRAERWGPRAIDLDLLLFDLLELKSPALELPHPRICYRRFVLEPAAEVAGEMVWPVNGWSVTRLLDNLNNTPKYIAVSRSDILSFEETLRRLELEGECRIVREPEPGMLPSRNLFTKLTRRFEKTPWQNDEVWRVSDFWLTGLCVRPRLVVVLEDPAHWWILANDSRPASLETEFIFDIKAEHSKAHQKFYKQLRKRCRGAESPPSIWLPSQDLEGIEREVLAAMQAME